MTIRSLGYRTDVMIRSMSGSSIEQRSGYTVVRTSSNPGFYWGNFLLFPTTPTAADAEQWTAWFTEEFPDARHRAYGIDSTDGESGDPAAIAALGVEVQADAVLVAQQLTAPPAPAIELRAFRDDADWDQLPSLRTTVYSETDEERPTPDSDPHEAAFVVRQSVANRQLVATGQAEWLGGFDDGRLVAALGIVCDGSGVARYQSVETHPDYRRRGIAGRLVYDAGALAAERFAAETLVIVADRDYHAIRLYQALGFVTAELQVQLQKTPT